MSLYHHILVAIDGSPDAEAALRHAASLARDQNARLTLLAVAGPGPAPVGPGTSVPADPVETHTALLRRAADSLPGDVGVTTRLEQGDPAETILRLAADEGHDLIVLGSHGHSRIHRALLGSVSERVLRGGTAPVLLTRAARGDGRPAPAPE